MDFNQRMLEQVDAEIARLQGIRTMLQGGSALQASTTRRVVPTTITRRRSTAGGRRATRTSTNRNIPKQVRRPMSAADRKKRSDAQKARWNRVRAAQSATPPAPQESDSHATPNASTPIKAVS